MKKLISTFLAIPMLASFIFSVAQEGNCGLGYHTKLGWSLIVMSIVGGAIAATFMSHIADTHSMRTGFVVPLVCFIFIAIYGAVWQKLETKYSDIQT